MAQRLAKTPNGLFKQVKPDAYTMRASIVDTPYRDPYSTLKRDYLTNNGSYINSNGQLRTKYGLAYNGTAATAQKEANENNKIVGTHNPQLNRFLPRTSGKYGQVKMPEGWKYKTPREQANAMLNDPELKEFTNKLYGGIVPGYPKK